MLSAPVRAACWVVLLALLLAASAGAQPTDQPVIARVTVKTPSDLQRFIALGLDVLEMREGDHLFILTTGAEADRLRADGWTVSVDLEHTSRLQEQQRERQRRMTPQLLLEPLFMGGYRTVPEIRALLDDKAAQYPDLAEVFVYGESWERVMGGPTAGHDLFGIKLTNTQRLGPKPVLFVMAAIHARELATSELALRFVEHLLSGYGIDGDLTWLLDEHLIVVVPVVNPDGRVLAEQGYLQRKNTDTSHGACAVPSIGVDLNRNSSFKWGTVNTPMESPCSETYPGPVPVSEPETAALLALIRSLFPDQRGPGDTDASPITTTGILLTLHSYSDLVMWPWGFTGTPAPNAADLSAIGRKLAAYNGYTPQQSIALYPTSGTTDDWAYGELGIAAFTFEVGPSYGGCGGFFPPFSCLDGGAGGSFWPRNLPAFLYAARIARAPFQLVRGPTAEAAAATLRSDGIVDLAVRLDEQVNGGQPIAAAEYYLDTPPWSGGSAIPMTAADGSFDATVELATAAVGPLAGRHLLFVRGQDSAGTWGPVRAVFTPDPSCAPGLSPVSQSFTAGGGTATVTLTVPDGCAWTASTVAAWIAITSGASGVGSGSVSYSVAPNASAAPRTGIIAIGGQSFAVSEGGQSPADLRVSQISPPPATAAPGTSFSVTDATENVGGLSAPGSTTRFYLSLDASKDAGDRLLSGGRAVPALGPGATSTGTVTVTIPSTMLLGMYYVLGCADDTAALTEPDETNNCRASATTVQVTRPDLVATSVSSPPAAAALGSGFLVTDTVKNQGIIPAPASYTQYYLSADTAKGGGDILLAGYRLVPSLAAGASFSGAAIAVAIPAATPLGTYYLLACADNPAGVSESDEINNCRASATTVQVTRPDLVATSVSSPPVAAAPGSSFSVTDTVKNQGMVPAAASYCRYYLSLDTGKGAGDILLGGYRPVPSLAPGVSSPGPAVALTIPSTTPLGSYYLLACADDTAIVAETDDTNNCRASATTVQVTRPDLVEATVSNPPTAAARGTGFSITDTVKNQGAVPAAASYTRYYLSVDTTKGSGDVLLGGYRPVPSLAAGASSPGPAITVTISATTPPGTYYLLACADDTAIVLEVDNANNCRASATRVIVTP